MNNKVICLLFLFLLTTLSLPLQACQDSATGLHVLSLEVTPQEVLKGEKASVKAETRNDGYKEEKYDIPLMVNRVAENRVFVTLQPGETKTIEFSFRRDEAGVYAISIGDQQSTLKVRDPIPATFKLSKLEIAPIEADINEEIVIKADIANIGEVQGKYTAELKINGIKAETDETIYLPGSTSFVVFHVSKDSPGTYTVNLGELTGQFTVVAPIIPIEITPACPPGTTYDQKRKC